MAVLTDTLRAQLREALRHYQPVCAADVLAAMQGHRALPEGALLVTIDDGYRDLQENAIPVMSQMGVEPAIFPRLPSEDGYPEWAPLDLLYVGRAMKGADTALPSFEWRERLLQLPLVDQLAMVREHIGNVSEEILWTERKKLYLSDQELRSLSNVAIGTHGIKHIRWTTVESDALNETLSRSLNWLKEIGGLPMASYPDGAFSSEIAKRLGALGFQAGFTLNSTISSVPSAYSIQRFVMPDDPEHLARVVKTKKENAAWADVQLSQ
jgi:peptidoglycan/xylan/chitin deacetylase (PgdA/CDA1 family)